MVGGLNCGVGVSGPINEWANGPMNGPINGPIDQMGEWSVDRTLMFGGVALGGGGGAVQLKELKVYVALGDSEMAKNYVPNMFQWQKGELEKIREKDNKQPGVGEEDEEEKEGGGGGKFKFPWQ